MSYYVECYEQTGEKIHRYVKTIEVATRAQAEVYLHKNNYSGSIYHS